MGLNSIFIGQIFHELLIHKFIVHLLLSGPISTSNSKYPRLNSPFCKTVPFLIFLLSLNSITTYIAPKTEAWETILAPSTPWHHISEVTMSYEFYLLVILEAIPINSNCQCFMPSSSLCSAILNGFSLSSPTSFKQPSFMLPSQYFFHTLKFKIIQ